MTLAESRWSPPLGSVDVPPADLCPATPQHCAVRPAGTPASGAPAGPPQGPSPRVRKGPQRLGPPQPTGPRTGHCSNSHVRNPHPAILRKPHSSGLRKRGSTPRDEAAWRGISSRPPSSDAPHSRNPAAPRSATGAQADQLPSARRPRERGRLPFFPRVATCACVPVCVCTCVRARAALTGTPCVRECTPVRGASTTSLAEEEGEEDPGNRCPGPGHRPARGHRDCKQGWPPGEAEG